jgi:hypothetical protein
MIQVGRVSIAKQQELLQSSNRDFKLKQFFNSLTNMIANAAVDPRAKGHSENDMTWIELYVRAQ